MKASLLVLLASSAVSLWAAESPLQVLARIGPEGRGNEAAQTAWKEIVAQGPSILIPLLEAAGTGSPVADNWLRLAADTILDRAQRAKHPLPTKEIEHLLLDPTRPAPTRQLAFDLLQKADPKRLDEIEPSLLNDPVQELRRGAVQRLITAAATASGDDSKALYLKALDAVRDEDQTKRVSEQLEKLGTKVDLAKHFGFLTRWHVVGPFDNTERRGFDTVFAPESELLTSPFNPAATYQTAQGSLAWKPLQSDDPFGKVDFNKPFGMLKDSTAYAATTFDSDTAREAELRLGCKNAWKVWLNGKLLFARDEYHRGQRMDQYKLKAALLKGPNLLVVKCCQNEQKETWTVEWDFQLRVCDSAGTALPQATSAAR